MYVLGCPIVIKGDLRFADCVLVDTDVSQLMFESVCVCLQICTPVLLIQSCIKLFFFQIVKAHLNPWHLSSMDLIVKNTLLISNHMGTPRNCSLSSVHTKPSTLKLAKKAVKENKRPLRVLREAENIQGGVMNAKSGCDLSRNRRQL